MTLPQPLCRVNQTDICTRTLPAHPRLTYTNLSTSIVTHSNPPWTARWPATLHLWPPIMKKLTSQRLSQTGSSRASRTVLLPLLRRRSPIRCRMEGIGPGRDSRLRLLLSTSTRLCCSPHTTHCRTKVSHSHPWVHGH